MPKGQQRSNKEQRKPKKPKAAASPAAPLGSAVRQADKPAKPGSDRRK